MFSFFFIIFFADDECKRTNRRTTAEVEVFPERRHTWTLPVLAPVPLILTYLIHFHIKKVTLKCFLPSNQKPSAHQLSPPPFQRTSSSTFPVMNPFTCLTLPPPPLFNFYNFLSLFFFIADFTEKKQKKQFCLHPRCEFTH